MSIGKELAHTSVNSRHFLEIEMLPWNQYSIVILNI